MPKLSLAIAQFPLSLSIFIDHEKMIADRGGNQSKRNFEERKVIMTDFFAADASTNKL